jgi:hypothetical protein
MGNSSSLDYRDYDGGDDNEAKRPQIIWKSKHPVPSHNRRYLDKFLKYLQLKCDQGQSIEVYVHSIGDSSQSIVPSNPYGVLIYVHVISSSRDYKIEYLEGYIKRWYEENRYKDLKDIEEPSCTV